MAAHVINPDQLRMFMTARELHGLTSTEVDPTHPGAWRSHEQMWSDKRKDNTQSWRQTSYGDDETFDQSVAKHGVEYPVRLTHGDAGPQIDSGHHRIQAAYDADPESYVPVTHTESSRPGPQERQPVTPRFRSYP